MSGTDQAIPLHSRKARLHNNLLEAKEHAMPLPNSAETQWIGYLVDGAGGLSTDFLEALRRELEGRQLPKAEVDDKKVSMWWRADSHCVDVRSKIDGEVLATVHAMDYGTSLFIGIAFAAVKTLGNYYKRMAAVAFLESIDRSTNAALTTISQGKATSIKSLEGAGKFGT